MPISNIEVYLELKTKGDFFHLRILLNNSIILNGTRQKTEKLQILLIMCKEKNVYKFEIVNIKSHHFKENNNYFELQLPPPL